MIDSRLTDEQQSVRDAARPSASPAAHEFEPIASYGMLSDCSSAALVSRTGSIDWLCLPRFDSPAVFSRLLDPRAGHWSIRPTGPFEVQRRYLPGTLVLETTFTTPTGTLRLTDALPFAAGQRGHELGLGAPHELLRSVEALAGSVDVVMELAPRPEYGLVRPLLRITDAGARTFGGPNQIALSSRVPLAVEDATLRAAFAPQAGERAGFCLVWAPAESRPPETCAPHAVSARIADTVEGWRSWEADHDIYSGPHRELIPFSSRELWGLSYRPTGAIVAAATTSLPEQIGGERNWDYRYAWIRDASLTMQALYVGTCPDETTDFVSFMTSSAGGGGEDALQIMYGIGGEHDLSERVLPHLRAGATRAQCGSATAPGTRRSSTSTASCWTRSTATASGSAISIPRSSASPPPWPMPPPRAGGSPTPECGRCAARRATTSRRRSTAGWRSTAPSRWDRGSGSSRGPNPGRWSVTTSTRRSSSADGAASAMRRRRPSTATSSTPRRC